MELSLNVLKNALISEGLCDKEWEETNNEWIKNNIGDGEVSIREWLDVFASYWSEFSDDYGDSGVIISILVNDYKLSNNDINEIMSVYWGCESVEEYMKEYDVSYDEYKN
jgi:hypothetical protein